MQAKFFWITDTYRVNVNCIFSLEDVQKDNSEEFNKWYEDYEKCLDNIKQDTELLSQIIKDINSENQEEIENALNQYIYTQIGQRPEEFRHEYYMILTNGLQVKISQYKYDRIHDIIDKYCV